VLCTRGLQKVHSLTQLTTEYVLYALLSLFNTVTSNINAFFHRQQLMVVHSGEVFIWSSIIVIIIIIDGICRALVTDTCQHTLNSSRWLWEIYFRYSVFCVVKLLGVLVVSLWHLHRPNLGSIDWLIDWLIDWHVKNLAMKMRFEQCLWMSLSTNLFLHSPPVPSGLLSQTWTYCLFSVHIKHPYVYV